MILKSISFWSLVSLSLLLVYCESDVPGEDDKIEWQPVFANLPAKAFVDVNIADIRAEESGRSERVSQALFCEVVEVLGENMRYARVRQEDGYEGWIRKSFLIEHEPFESAGPYTVISNLAPAYDSRDNSSKRITSLPYGCRLHGEELNGFLKIASDRYGEIFVSLRDLANPGSEDRVSVPDSAALCAEAEKFFGAPYLWGGRSFYGIDCSGFTQLILKRFGVDMPRDTKDQIKVGTEVNREDIRAGDLIFFPRHVGLAVSKDLMIHSTGSNAGVAYNSLDPDHPLYSKYHDENFVTARRVID